MAQLLEVSLTIKLQTLSQKQQEQQNDPKTSKMSSDLQ